MTKQQDRGVGRGPIELVEVLATLGLTVLMPAHDKGEISTEELLDALRIKVEQMDRIADGDRRALTTGA